MAAGNKISQLESLTESTLHNDDLFVVVDVSDNSTPTGETKNVKLYGVTEYLRNEFILKSGSGDWNSPSDTQSPTQLSISEYALSLVSSSLDNFLLRSGSNSWNSPTDDKAPSQLNIASYISQSINSLNTGGVKETITETNSFSVGNVIRRTSSGYALSDSSNSGSAEVLGLIESANPSQFSVVYSGKMSWPSHGFTAGDILFLSSSGQASSNLPSDTEISKPIGTVLDSDNILVQTYRGSLINETVNSVIELSSSFESTVNNLSSSVSSDISSLETNFNVVSSSYNATSESISKLELPDSQNSGKLFVSDGSSGTFSFVSNATKNIIYNGVFEVWQRGFTFNPVVNGSSTADMWKYFKNGTGAHNIEHSHDAPTVSQTGFFTNDSYKVTCITTDASLSAGDYYHTVNRIEGAIFRRLAQRPMTLSFWVKSNQTGIYCVSLKNSGQDKSFVSEYTINSVDTWEKKVINIPATPADGTWNYGNGIGLSVGFTLASGTSYNATPDMWLDGNFMSTNNQVNAISAGTTFYLTRVQLEDGNIATDYEYVDHAFEVFRCQRYFAPVKDLRGWVGSPPSKIDVSGQFSSNMRAAPNILLYNPPFVDDNGAILTYGSADTIQKDTTKVRMILNVSPAGTYKDSVFYAGVGHDRIFADASL